MAYSCALDDAGGFCKSSFGMTMAALRAMGWRAVPSAYAWNILASSAVNRLPALPDGVRNRLRCQCILLQLSA